MYKIYIQNKPLFLASEVNGEIETHLHQPETIFIDELTTASVKTMLSELQKADYTAGIFLHNDPDAVLKAVKKHLVVIIAAGGLVHVDQSDFLLIFRKAKWDLPKGKLDEGETLESCAVREVEEETGATQLTLEQPLTITYHTYHQNGKHILKESHWFLIKTPKKSPLHPQIEEDIEQCVWVSADAIPQYTANMHASVIDVLAEAKKILSRKGA